MNDKDKIFNKESLQQEDLQQKIFYLEKELDSFKRSLSYRLGLFITWPFRYFNKLFRTRKGKENKIWLFFKIIGNTLKHPFKVFREVNLKNFKILIQALKEERPSEIYYNFQKKIQKKIEPEPPVVINLHTDETNRILGSGYFDESYYRLQFPSNFFNDINPVEHYFTKGGFEGKNPSPLFDSKFYTDIHRDVKIEGINPLYHYLVWGENESRRIKAVGEPDRFRADEKPVPHYSGRFKILFIAHDGNMAGAEIFLLDLIRWIRKNSAFSMKIIALEGGPLMKEFEELAPVLYWQDYKSIDNPFSLNCILFNFCNEADLIYGNTVLAPAIYKHLSYLNAPVITHIHELQNTIELFLEQGKIEPLNQFDQHFIACSPAVTQNLIQNHQIKKEKITTINSFIKIDNNIQLNRENFTLYRKAKGLKQEPFIVFGCGTIYPRKGTDLFIETAIALKEKGVDNFHFYWIGNNIWDLENSDNKLPNWDNIKRRIKDKKVSGHITFLGEKYNVPDYLKAGNLFYLPSREDPFPLVCLEAAQFGLPIICFKDAGGMPEFVSTDAGFIVPMEDINGAADAIIKLINDKELCSLMGSCAQQKVLEKFSLEIGAKKIMDVCNTLCSFKPTVSVILPNYNHATFLEKRIDSILNQTFTDFELIILDDCSTDNSMEIIGRYKSLKNVRVLTNNKNSGNVFSQWELGLKHANGELIWIAEADDYCEKTFLEKMLPYFNDQKVTLAFCNSDKVNENNEITGDYSEYFKDLDPNHWLNDYIVNDTEEINFGLGAKNTIVNASSVIFRKSDLKDDFLILAKQFRLSGDWIFYLQMIKEHKIAFCYEKLNFHRKHSQTVTSNTHQEDNKKTIIDEALRIHKYVIENFNLNKEYFSHWERYVKAQIDGLYSNVKNYSDYYPFNEIKNQIIENISKTHINRKIVLVSNAFNLTGAPINLYHIAKVLHEKYSFHCITFAFNDGELINDFRVLGEAYLVSGEWIPEKGLSISSYLGGFTDKPQVAFVNTIESCQLIPCLKNSGLKVVSAIHDYTYAHGTQYLEMLYEQSDHVVYSVDFMLNKNKNDYQGIDLKKISIIPQGLYQYKLLSSNVTKFRQPMRSLLGIPVDAFVVFGCGTIHPIKGVDIFINTAIEVIHSSRSKREIHFVWLGGELKSNSSDMYVRFLHRDIINSGLTQKIHFLPKDSSVERYFSIADIFLLSSREDPFPSVVLEAMAVGIPILAIDGSTGSAQLIKESKNFLVGYSERASLATKILFLMENKKMLEIASSEGKRIINEKYQFSTYVDNLVKVINEKLNVF
jgi:glycosyltransferase involved in cell wall biosynthesis